MLLEVLWLLPAGGGTGGEAACGTRASAAAPSLVALGLQGPARSSPWLGGGGRWLAPDHHHSCSAPCSAPSSLHTPWDAGTSCRASISACG